MNSGHIFALSDSVIFISLSMNNFIIVCQDCLTHLCSTAAECGCVLGWLTFTEGSNWSRYLKLNANSSSSFCSPPFCPDFMMQNLNPFLAPLVGAILMARDQIRSVVSINFFFKKAFDMVERPAWER